MELDCEHTFCEDCLYDHLTSGIQSAFLCPKCRNDIDSITPVPKLLHQLLDELEAICPNQRTGCEAHLKRYTMNDHINRYCEFTEVDCPSADCEGSAQRRFLDGDRCLHYLVECEYCQQLMMELDTKEHLERNCPQALLSCDHCGAFQRRSETELHVEQHCQKFPISCLGKIVGCSVTDARDMVNEHMKTCPFAVMAPHIREQNERHAKLREETSQVREQMVNIDNRLEELEKSFRLLSTTMRLQRRRSLEPETTISTNRVEELAGRVNDLATDYNSRLDNVTSENARMHVAFYNENINNARQFHTLNAALTSLRGHVAHMSNPRTPASTASSGATSAGSGPSAVDSRREPPKL